MPRKTGADDRDGKFGVMVAIGVVAPQMGADDRMNSGCSPVTSGVVAP